MKSIFFILFAPLFSFGLPQSHVLNNFAKATVKTMIEHSDPRLYLLSYPRSGNTWLRYCIEVLTQRPTGSFLDIRNKTNLPLGLLCGHEINFSKNPVWKVHIESHMNFEKFRYSSSSDILILVIRNPKENIIRNLNGKKLKEVSIEHLEKIVGDYFNNLKLFDKWSPSNRLLVFYEDLISTPLEVLTSILNFLGDSCDPLVTFMDDYEKHKKTALKIYEYAGGSRSKGEDLIFHSRKFTKEDRIELETIIKNANTLLWEKYLHNNYSEEALENQGLYKTHLINKKYRSFLLDNFDDF